METNKKIEVLEKSDNERKSSVEDLKCEVEQIVLSSDEIEKIRKESRIDIVKQDPYLNPYQDIILKRLKTYKESILEIEKNEKSLVDFAKSHERIGIFYNQEDKYVHFTEYAPGAKSISIVRIKILYLIYYSLSKIYLVRRL